MSLPSPISVNPQARDIVFDFRDSCNCCTSCKPGSPQAYYVNSQGQLEPYKLRKAMHDTSQAFTRALSHLNATLERRVISFDGDPSVFQRKAESILASIHAIQSISPSHIAALNDLMLEYFHEKASGVKHVVFEDELISPGMLVEEPKPIEPSRCLIL